MKRKILGWFVPAALLVALAAGGAWCLLEDKPAEKNVAGIAAPFADCSELLRQAASALGPWRLRTEADAERAAEALGQAFDAVEALPNPTEADIACINEALTALAKAWWDAESRALPPEISEAPALIHQLYVRRTPITDALLEENGIMQAKLSRNALHDDNPDLKHEQDAWLQAVQARHDAADKRVYGGGNGRSEQEAIEIIPLIGQEADEEKIRELIFAYLREVYGSVDACYMSFIMYPDGRYYKICSLYNGTFRDSEGKLRMRVLPVYFRAK